MNDDDLITEIADIGAALSGLNSASSALRARHNALKQEQAKRGIKEREVTDHAVVRYLERRYKIDVSAIRDELRGIAKEATPAKDGEHYWHEATEMILVVNEIGRIVTVLGPDQIEKWRGRKLSNGQRVPTATPCGTTTPATG